MGHLRGICRACELDKYPANARNEPEMAGGCLAELRRRHETDSTIRRNIMEQNLLRFLFRELKIYR